MPLLTRLSLKIPALPWLTPAQVAPIADAVFRPAVEEAGLYAWRQIKQRTPVGATEVLRGSVQQATEVLRGTPVQYHSTVSTVQPYALAVEHGTRPHWAPIGPLQLWARRVLGDEQAAYAVQWKIAREGTKGQHFFARGVDAARPRVLAIFRAASATFAARLRGGR